MAREASLHPISDNLMGNDCGYFMLMSSSKLIGRANRWGNCLGHAEFCDRGSVEMKLPDWVILQDCTVFESLSIAQELGIDELRMCCEDHINSTLNVHNACTFLPACLELENRIPGTYDNTIIKNSRSSRMEVIGGLGIPLCSLWPTLHCRRVAGVSPLLSIGWWYLSSVSPKRHCCRVSAADKGCRVYPFDPRPDAVALYSGCTPGKHRA
ncbi:uncharacterized protein TNCV_3598741 [Trichonephila clavipes]|nr:uncharacterized protein TNCV_3598741 [Trichonephila clavipes]